MADEAMTPDDWEAVVGWMKDGANEYLVNGASDETFQALLSKLERHIEATLSREQMHYGR